MKNALTPFKNSLIVLATLALSVAVALFSMAATRNASIGPCCDEGLVVLFLLSIALPVSWLLAALVWWGAAATGRARAWLAFPVSALLLAAILPHLGDLLFSAMLRGQDPPDYGNTSCLAQECGGTQVSVMLPSGQARLAGRLLLEGQPLAGAKIRLMTEDQGITDAATTDEFGHYEMRLPEGTYSFTRAWIDDTGLQPSDYTLVTGHELRLERGAEPGVNYFPAAPLEIELLPGSPAKLDFAYHRKPMTYALKAGGANVLQEDIYLQWQRVAGASTYAVIVSEEEHDPDASGSRRLRRLVHLLSETHTAALGPIVKRVPDGTVVPVYVVETLAFDADDAFISEDRGGRLLLPTGWMIDAR